MELETLLSLLVSAFECKAAYRNIKHGTVHIQFAELKMSIDNLRDTYMRHNATPDPRAVFTFGRMSSMYNDATFTADKFDPETAHGKSMLDFVGEVDGNQLYIDIERRMVDGFEKGVAMTDIGKQCRQMWMQAR